MEAIDKEQIKQHIQKRENEQKLHRMCWEYIERLHLDVGLSDSTYTELRAKISSKMAQCERSIIDHQRLL